MNNEKETQTKDTTELQSTPDVNAEDTSFVDVGDTLVIDTAQLKELSANISDEQVNTDEDKSNDDTPSSDSVSTKAQTPDSDESDSPLAESEETDDDDFDDIVEGQTDMFDDEDDFSSPDDETIVEKPEPETTQETDDEDNFEYNFSVPAKVKKWFVGIITVIIVLFIAAYILGVATLPENTIYKNIYVEDINVGGLTYDQALEKLSSASLFDDQNINISYQTQNYTIDGKSVALEASVEATAEKAYNYGKTGNKYLDGFYNMSCLFVKHTIMPAATMDTAKLDQHIVKFANQCLGELKQHNIVVQADGQVYIGAGETGFDMNVEPARNTIIESLASDRFMDIKIPISPAAPDDLTIEAFDAAVYRDPIDAHYECTADEATVIPEQIGRYINKDEAAPLLETVKEGAAPVYIPWYQSEAQITAAMLQEKLFSTVLGSFPTYYGGAYNRNRNVERAAALLNNAVVAPGEVFSFNDRVGARSVANGFFSAPEYANGQTVIGIGGGTCQVSTTLYGAVLYADMDIVSRTAHMFPVSYAPRGQDATVAYGSLDFKFKNSSDYPIKIVTKTSGGRITVEILGTAWEPAKKVELRHSGGGYYISSKRLIYDADGNLVETETLPSSSYKAH